MHEPVETGHVSVAPATQDAEFKTVRHGIRVGGYQLLLPAGIFSELSNKARICALPDTPSWFAGFINNRGHTVPVYDLHLLLGAAPVDTREAYWILLLDQQPRTAGFIIKQFPLVLSDPVSVPVADLGPLPEELRSCILGEYRHQDSSWYEVDHRVLLHNLKSIFNQSFEPAAP